MTQAGGQHVVFSLAGQDYGIPIREVREILRMLAITRVPELPPAVLGVINIRGTITPVIDVARKLNLPGTEPDDGTKILVVDRGGRYYAFLANRVTEVLELAPEQSGPPSDETTPPPPHGAVVGVARGPNGLIVLLDPAHLLADEEIAAIDGLTRG